MRSAKLTNFLTLLCSVFQLRELNSIMRAELRTPTGLRSKRLVIDVDQINFIQAYLIELIFHWMPEIMQNFTGFAAPRSVIGPENSHHLLHQSDKKFKSIVAWDHVSMEPCGYGTPWA